MDWLNLHISVLDSPQVLRCDPTRRATWLFLLRYCIGQENGGLIEDCRAWGDTTWQQLARVKLKEVNATCPLWAWEGDNLRVTFYPAEKETEVQAKRELARTNGQRGGRPRKTNIGSETETKEKPTSVNSAKAEGNGKEGEGNGTTPAAAAAVVGADTPDSLHPEPPARPERPAATATLLEPRERSIADLQAVFPALLVTDRDRERARALLRLYQWDACAEAMTELGRVAAAREPGKRRVFIGELSDWLAKTFTPERSDYERAGLPVPPGAAP